MILAHYKITCKISALSKLQFYVWTTANDLWNILSFFWLHSKSSICLKSGLSNVWVEMIYKICMPGVQRQEGVLKAWLQVLTGVGGVGTVVWNLFPLFCRLSFCFWYLLEVCEKWLQLSKWTPVTPRSWFD